MALSMLGSATCSVSQLVNFEQSSPSPPGKTGTSWPGQGWAVTMGTAPTAPCNTRKSPFGAIAGVALSTAHQL
jgi:hypothetical protein